MAKKKNYWYVLVMTVEGPKYVTEVHRGALKKLCGISLRSL